MSEQNEMLGYDKYRVIIEDASISPEPGAIPYIRLVGYVIEKGRQITFSINPQLFQQYFLQDIQKEVAEIADHLKECIGKEITLYDKGSPDGAPKLRKHDSHVERVPGYVPPEEFDPDTFEMKD